MLLLSANIIQKNDCIEFFSHKSIPALLLFEVTKRCVSLFHRMHFGIYLSLIKLPQLIQHEQ